MRNSSLKQAAAIYTLALSLTACSGIPVNPINASEIPSNGDLTPVPTLTVDPKLAQPGEYDGVAGLVPYYNVDAAGAIGAMSEDEQELVYDVLTIKEPELRFNVAVLAFNKGQFPVELNLPEGRLFANGMATIARLESGEYVFATNRHVLDFNYEDFVIQPETPINIVIPGVGVLGITGPIEFLGGSDDFIGYTVLPEQIQTILGDLESEGYAQYPELSQESPRQIATTNTVYYYYDSLEGAVVPIRIIGTDPDDMITSFITLSDDEISELNSVLDLPVTTNPHLCAGFSGSAIFSIERVGTEYRILYHGGVSSRGIEIEVLTARIIAGEENRCSPVDQEGNNLGGPVLGANGEPYRGEYRPQQLHASTLMSQN